MDNQVSSLEREQEVNQEETSTMCPMMTDNLAVVIHKNRTLRMMGRNNIEFITNRPKSVLDGAGSGTNSSYIVLRWLHMFLYHLECRVAYFYENHPLPVPGPDEVLLEMAFVGICGSDVHYLEHGRIGNFILKEPMVSGHESSGVVLSTGQNVKNILRGDRVAIEPGVSCRLCRYCKRGLYNLCPDMAFCATPPFNGNLCRYYVHPYDFCHKIPDNVSLEEAALVEPLSVAVHACRKAGVGLGSNVLITGAGAIGMVTLLTAKAMSAKNVLMTDIQQKRLDMAKKFGADHTFLVSPKDDLSELSLKMKKLIKDYPDVTIDCSGFESSLKLAIEATKPGGVIVLVGMGAEEVKISLIPAIVKEIKILGSFRYANDYPTAIDMISAKKVDVLQLVTDRYRLEDSLQAFAKARTGEPLKVMIRCTKNRHVF